MKSSATDIMYVLFFLFEEKSNETTCSSWLRQTSCSCSDFLSWAETVSSCSSSAPSDTLKTRLKEGCVCGGGPADPICLSVLVSTWGQRSTSLICHQRINSFHCPSRSYGSELKLTARRHWRSTAALSLCHNASTQVEEWAAEQGEDLRWVCSTSG